MFNLIKKIIILDYKTLTFIELNENQLDKRIESVLE